MISGCPIQKENNLNGQITLSLHLRSHRNNEEHPFRYGLSDILRKAAEPGSTETKTMERIRRQLNIDHQQDLCEIYNDSNGLSPKILT